MQLAKQEIQEAHERTHRILKLKSTGGWVIFQLGYQFKLVKEDYDSNPQRAYELYGYENFIQYHSQPGIAYSVTSTNRFIRLYETYVIKLGISEDDPNLKVIDYTVLDLMTKFVDRENVNDWLRRAASMGRRDLALAVRSEGKEETCSHVAVDIWEVQTCQKCGDEISKRRTNG
jgi:hypothetical protein